jgi:hypothetical protein
VLLFMVPALLGLALGELESCDELVDCEPLPTFVELLWFVEELWSPEPTLLGEF